MILALLLAAAPAIYWEHGASAAGTLKRHGVDRVRVPATAVGEWRGTGIDAVGVTPEELKQRTRAQAPRIDPKIQVASATRSPWLIANGWRFQRNPTGRFYSEASGHSAALAVAEAFACGADLLVKIGSADLERVARVFSLFRRIAATELPALAEVAVIDDGTHLTGEVMNLLARRNVMFRVATAPDPAARINIRIGSKEYPKAAAANPAEFALRIRREIGDDNRLVRVFGSEIVLARLTGNDRRARLFLLHYGQGSVRGLRVRLQGRFARGELHGEAPGAALEDFVAFSDSTEFSVPEIGTCAVVDLERQP
jgi:hypothetical protein